jgi:hypothetical protein
MDFLERAGEHVCMAEGAVTPLASSSGRHDQQRPTMHLPTCRCAPPTTHTTSHNHQRGSYDDYSSYAGSPALGAGPGSGAALGTSAGSDRTFARMRRAAGSAAASPGGEEEELEGDEGEGGEEEVEYEMEEELDDEALARRLHEQDQRELYQRMLEMSGYHTMTQGEGGWVGWLGFKLVVVRENNLGCLLLDWCAWPVGSRHVAPEADGTLSSLNPAAADAEEEDHMDGMTYEVRRRGTAGGGWFVTRALEPQQQAPKSTCPATHPTNRPTNPPTNRPTDQLTNRPTDQNLQALGDMAGVVSRGLSEAAIQKLPQMTLSQLQQQPGKQQRASDEAEACGGGASAAEPHRCTICLVDLEEDGEQVERLGFGGLVV